MSPIIGARGGLSASAYGFTSAVALGLAPDILVVAGGGGGGSYAGGGGGAGGFKAQTSFTLDLNTSYTVTIGAGGTGGSFFSGVAGSNSVFGSITSTGGGFGAGQEFGRNGGAGGSGGGASGSYNGMNGTGGAASPSGQGNAGGSTSGGTPSVAYAAAGGGGAGAAGGSNTGSGVAGAGGAGLANSYSGTSVTYAGGGGGSADPQSGGAGGSGGGGNGANTGTAGAGSVNTGGGGGGVWNPNGTGGAGGSGIVIARYSGTTQRALGGTVTTSGGNTIHTFTSSGKFYTGTAPAVTGYALWLDASDASTFSYSSGVVVSQWNDKSGSSRNFTQATVANQPSRNVTQNGLSGLTFNADFMANTGFNWVNSAFTVFVVMKYIYPVFNFTGILGSNASSGPTMGMNSDDAFATFKVGVSSSPYNLFPTSSNADVAVWKAPGVSSGSLTTTFYKNGTQASATTTMTGLATGTGAVLGASTTGAVDMSPANNFTSIYEVLVYPSQLSDVDRNNVEGYLRAKWGTP